ncbi:5'-nucleotidase [Aquimarina sp. MAR_2010_214]|uniref:5'-nucleotidase C-terminal domain-containing protein n=1 Tax=Aquimarina sp. MAR_2010_214 TaxID=1250026 RepID=UPI000C712574|nr:5'-nucleotidase [Aquimarina sp. MAR_2010_214]PKV49137.1 5'-nucleotidase [Aquimarina sp. MAR_2010_214]
MNTRFYNLLLGLFCLISICSCRQQSVSVNKISAVQQKIDSTIVTDKAIDSFIAPFRDHLNKTLDATLCIAAVDFTKDDGKLESKLGNLTADISLQQVEPIFKKRYNKEIDFVLLNHGGMRAPILKGPVTARTAFEVMPFENELVVAELSYEKVQELASYLAEKQRAHPVSNLRLSIVKQSKEVQELIVNDKPLREDKSYFVLTTDYLQQGGDRMNFFKDPIRLYKTDYKLRNALIDYFKSIDTLKVQLDKRMRYAE